MKTSIWGLDTSWITNLFYHASKNSDEPNSTIRSFLFNLCKILRTHNPTFLVAAIDSHLSFRKELDPSYKSNRPEKDENYIFQLEQIKEALDALGIPAICVDYYEADDVLATLAEEAKQLEIPFVSVISDKDFRQALLSGKVGMYNKPKGTNWRFFSQKMAEEDWNIKISQCVDYQCLVGDTCDCIQGCQFIGPKRASELLNKFGSIAEIYENLSQVPEKLRPYLEIFQTRLDLVRKLVTLRTDCGNFGNVLEHYEVKDFKINKSELHKILVRNDITNLERLLWEVFNI